MAEPAHASEDRRGRVLIDQTGLGVNERQIDAHIDDDRGDPQGDLQDYQARDDPRGEPQRRRWTAD